MIRPARICTAVLLLAGCRPVVAAPTLQAFGSPAGPSRYTLGGGAAVADGALRLLDGATSPTPSAAFDRTAKGLYGHIDAHWKLLITPGAKGICFALLNTGEYGKSGPAPDGTQWESPNLKRSLAVAFDTYDPPTRNPFNTERNIMGREQREVALLWGDTEITRVLSPVEYRTGQWVAARLVVDAVCGGSDVTLQLAGKPVISHLFVPRLTPYECRAAFGAQAGDATSRAEIDDVNVSYARPMQAPAPPVVVRGIDGQTLDSKNHTRTAEVSFPSNTAKFGRIVCAVTLAEPEGGYDPWDRCSAIYVYGPDGEKYELARIITPYRRGYIWYQDVTDLRPLLQGKRRMEAWCETYATGWKYTVELLYFPGRAESVAYKVQNLWNGKPEIGNASQPETAFFTPKRITLDKQAAGAKLRFVVTGHGQAPNTDNAAEFIPLKRWVSVNGSRFENLLWKTDNYLNPCRPQGGTWKYDRAGWGPGTMVEPWTIDLKGIAKPGKPLTVNYAIEKYVNTSRDAGNPPIHWVASQVIFYRSAK